MQRLGVDGRHDLSDENRANGDPNDNDELEDNSASRLLKAFGSRTRPAPVENGFTSRTGTAEDDNSEVRDNSDDAIIPATSSEPVKLAQQPRPSVAVEIPTLTEDQKKDYEPLPGAEIVDRVLDRRFERGQEVYRIIFYDYHEESVTKPHLLDLINGSQAFYDFKTSSYTTGNTKKPQSLSSTMVTTRGGRKSLRDGYLDTTQILISSSDDEPSRKRARKEVLGKQATQGIARRSLRRSFRSSRSAQSSASDSESEGRAFRSRRRSSRLRFGGNSRQQTEFSEDDEDEDEIDEDEFDEDSEGIVRRTRPKGVRGPGRPPKHSGGGQRLKLKHGTQIDSNFRRSSRTRGLPRRSMRERGEDEISENEAKVTGTRIIVIKEIFPELPEQDPFRLRHRQICDNCGDYETDESSNPFAFCQGCTHSYHKQCLGSRGTRDHLVTKAGPDDFVLQCRRCVDVAHEKDMMLPELGVCQDCKESTPSCKPFRVRKSTRLEQQEREANGGEDPVTEIDPDLLYNPSNVMFRCATCQRAWHMQHLPRRSNGDRLALDDDHDGDEETLAKKRFEEYSNGWTCKDCFNAPKGGIDSLVAWRPTDMDIYQPGSSSETVPEDDKEYLVKWKRLSYFQATWMPGSWVASVAANSMRRAFNKKDPTPKMRTEEAIPEDWFRVDIVLDVKYTSIVSDNSREVQLGRVKDVQEAFVKYKGLGYEDAVWEKPPSPEDGDRWDDFKAAYEDWVAGHYIHIPNYKALKRHIDKARAVDFETDLMLKEQPKTVVSGSLMDYQLEGLNWLYFKWYKGQNAILADEMGLGKTIQLIGLFSVLVERHKCWPFLVVVPNSTCPNWRREIKKWAPHLRVVAYYGSSTSRKLAHDYELFPNRNDDLQCHVVVTSYDAVIDPHSRKLTRKVKWAGLIVDEGQRLKNDGNLLYEELRYLNAPFQVLLTGTPLQNNARELFNLLQFLDKSIKAKEMEVEYENLTAENVPKLHNLIRPFFLRRTKVQVLTFLPPLAQIIIPVTMSVVQKKLYKSILAKNSQLIKSIFRRTSGLKQNERSNLNNILMQLRKCLCHPFVYSSSIEERSMNAAVSHRNLVEASSKLQLLEIMLPKLHERGHRVLLFSQFLDQLDIMEDFLDGLSLKHRRLDGSMNAMEKQKRIDAFNAPDSPYFAFLLSTRSGGVGINLATADTVIILDPDFNPHQDIQALSRAHRIGQTKKVLVFQLMTRDSAEEKIMQIGKKKMALDHILIERMGEEEDAGLDLESILKHGAAALFEDDGSSDIRYDGPAIDRLLDRSQAESTATGEDASAESQFSFARVWTSEKNTFQDGLKDDERPVNNSVWEKILKEREREQAAENAARLEGFGRGKRKRLNVDYTANDGNLDTEFLTSPLRQRRDEESDTDFQAREVESEPESIDEDEMDDWNELADTQTKSQKPRGILAPQRPQPVQAPNPNQVRSFRRVQVPPQPTQTDGMSDPSLQNLPQPLYDCLACGNKHSVGYCPLKFAGVEHCGLCGLAHFGYQRTCPHLNSEVQVATMLGTLKQSTEHPLLVEEATKYLRGIRGGLVQKKKQKAEREERERARLTGMDQAKPRITANGMDNYNSSTYNFKASVPIPRFPPSTQNPNDPVRPSMGERRRSH